MRTDVEVFPATVASAVASTSRATTNSPFSVVAGTRHLRRRRQCHSTTETLAHICISFSVGLCRRVLLFSACVCTPCGLDQLLVDLCAVVASRGRGGGGGGGVR